MTVGYCRSGQLAVRKAGKGEAVGVGVEQAVPPTHGRPSDGAQGFGEHTVGVHPFSRRIGHRTADGRCMRPYRRGGEEPPGVKKSEGPRIRRARSRPARSAVVAFSGT